MNNETDSVLMIHPASGRFSLVWQVGYVLDGEFRPFAGVTTEAGLEAVIERERTRRPGLTIEDRR